MWWPWCHQAGAAHASSHQAGAAHAASHQAGAAQARHQSRRPRRWPNQAAHLAIIVVGLFRVCNPNRHMHSRRRQGLIRPPPWSWCSSAAAMHRPLPRPAPCRAKRQDHLVAKHRAPRPDHHVAEPPPVFSIRRQGARRPPGNQAMKQQGLSARPREQSPAREMAKPCARSTREPRHLEMCGPRAWLEAARSARLAGLLCRSELRPWPIVRAERVTRTGNRARDRAGEPRRGRLCACLRWEEPPGCAKRCRGGRYERLVGPRRAPSRLSRARPRPWLTGRTRGRQGAPPVLRVRPTGIRGRSSRARGGPTWSVGAR
jgi:hypothetical protein